MGDDLISDGALRAAQIALDGLAMRQQVVGRNIANVDTPGYRSQTVRFEETLQRAMDRGPEVNLATTHSGHLAAPKALSLFSAAPRAGGTVRADGNNVDIDVELVQMSEDALRYQTMSQLVSKKLLLLKAITMAR